MYFFQEKRKKNKESRIHQGESRQPVWQRLTKSKTQWSPVKHGKQSFKPNKKPVKPGNIFFGEVAVRTPDERECKKKTHSFKKTNRVKCIFFSREKEEK